MVNQGASFKDVADVLGHRSLQTTGIYAKLDVEALVLHFRNENQADFLFPRLFTGCQL